MLTQHIACCCRADGCWRVRRQACPGTCAVLAHSWLRSEAQGGSCPRGYYKDMKVISSREEPKHSCSRQPGSSGEQATSQRPGASFLLHFSVFFPLCLLSLNCRGCCQRSRLAWPASWLVGPGSGVHFCAILCGKHNGRAERSRLGRPPRGYVQRWERSRLGCGNQACAWNRRLSAPLGASKMSVSMSGNACELMRPGSDQGLLDPVPGAPSHFCPDWGMPWQGTCPRGQPFTRTRAAGNGPAPQSEEAGRQPRAPLTPASAQSLRP